MIKSQSKTTGILYISDSSIPSYSANSIHVMKMCQAWASLGYSVTLLGKNTNACVKNVSDVHGFYGVDSTFTLEVHPSSPFPGSGRVYNLLLAFWIGSRYDLIYTRAIYAALWCVLMGKQVAFEIHEPFDTKGWLLGKIFRFLTTRKKVIKWVFISEALRKNIQQRYPVLKDENVLVAHDGADPMESVHLTEEKTAKSSRLKIAYVGSLLKGKGIEIIIPLSKRCPDVEFHIVGGSNADVEAAKAQLESDPGNVTFYGFVPHRDTVNYIMRSDVLIAPYLKGVFVKNGKYSNNIAQWMSPLKIFEYMSSGKPMITSDLPVLREVLTHGKNALLCDPDKLDSWEHAIRQLSGDPSLGKAIGEKARQDFLHHYTWKQRAKNILSSIRL